MTLINEYEEWLKKNNKLYIKDNNHYCLIFFPVMIDYNYNLHDAYMKGKVSMIKSNTKEKLFECIYNNSFLYDEEDNYYALSGIDVYYQETDYTIYNVYYGYTIKIINIFTEYKRWKLQQ